MTILEALAQAEEQGLFRRAADGDDKAASYFVRYAAQLANPNGADPNGWGVLKKGGGKNIDGYAEDALVFGSDRSELHNVYDFVLGAGGSNASVNYGAGPVNRRSSDTWEAPRELTAGELAYIGATSVPVPTPPPSQPPPPAGPGEYQDELDAIQRQLGELRGDVQGIPGAVAEQVQAAVEAELAETVGDPVIRDGISETVRRALKSQTFTARNRILGTITLTPNE
jgi:hypothetical protein